MVSEPEPEPEPKPRPIEEAEEVAADITELASGAMQSVKEKVSGAVQSGAEKVAEVWDSGKQQVAAAVGASGGDDVEEDQAPPHDPDRDLGHAGWSKPAPGPLERMKESAVHAVEGVKMRLHLAGAHGSEQPTAEQRTGESIHMAKAAEGRNVAQDDPIDHALHDALKPEPGEKPETSAFPETLGEALALAQMRDLPKNPPSAAAAAAATSGEAGSSEVEPAPPNPFSASSARSKL